jgi:hypothetical protein
MASIKRRTTKAGDNRYDVRYRLPDGAVRTRTFPTHRRAKNFAATVEADKLRGEWIDRRSARVTLKEYAEQWRTSRVHRSSTQAQVETHLRRHVLRTSVIAASGPSDRASFRPGCSNDRKSSHRPPSS